MEIRRVTFSEVVILPSMRRRRRPLSCGTSNRKASFAAQCKLCALRELPIFAQMPKSCAIWRADFVLGFPEWGLERLAVLARISRRTPSF